MSETTQDGADRDDVLDTLAEWLRLNDPLDPVHFHITISKDLVRDAKDELTRLRAENERLSRALGRDRDAFLTIMSSSAAEVDRARQADERGGPEWNGPGEEWWEAFELTVSDACFPGAPVFPTRAALKEPSNG